MVLRRLLMAIFWEARASLSTKSSVALPTSTMASWCCGGFGVGVLGLGVVSKCVCVPTTCVNVCGKARSVDPKPPPHHHHHTNHSATSLHRTCESCFVSGSSFMIRFTEALGICSVGSSVGGGGGAGLILTLAAAAAAAPCCCGAPPPFSVPVAAAGGSAGSGFGCGGASVVAVVVAGEAAGGMLLIVLASLAAAALVLVVAGGGATAAAASVEGAGAVSAIIWLACLGACSFVWLFGWDSGFGLGSNALDGEHTHTLADGLASSLCLD